MAHRELKQEIFDGLDELGKEIGEKALANVLAEYLDLLIASMEQDTMAREWKKQVDVELFRLCGRMSEHLPDYCYADDFEKGCTPRMTAKRALKAAKEF